jgi:FRG domain
MFSLCSEQVKVDLGWENDWWWTMTMNGFVAAPKRYGWKVGSNFDLTSRASKMIPVVKSGTKFGFGDKAPKVDVVSSYLNLISEIKPAIERFTGNTFDFPEREVEKMCREYDCFEFWLRRSTTYLAHLRHCGFPSPLLDWSKSPYVAAYFAFARAKHDGNVAIYAYRERANSAGFKVSGSDTPQIVSFGPIVKTHRRHFRQQSRYTTCVRWRDVKWYFEPHESVFGQKDNLQQDLLWKITIPARERMKAIRFLDKFNLNEFTLFDSEEALLEMLAMQVFDLREGRA